MTSDIVLNIDPNPVITQVLLADKVITVETNTDQLVSIVTEGPQGPPAIWDVVEVAESTVLDVPIGLVEYEVDCSDGDIDITLPNSCRMIGYDLRVIRVNVSEHLVNVYAAKGQTINDLSFWTLYDKGECLQLNARNGYWRIA